MFTRYIRPGLSLVFTLTLMVGFIYPFALAGVGRLAFARQAEGSLLRRNGVLIGSELIGQNFTDPKHFWGRPSATTPQPYNAINSGGSNFGPLNPALIDKVNANAKALHDADPLNKAEIPVELVTASTSGLDPEISPAAALYQAARVARARNIPIAKVRALIEAHQRKPVLGVLGEPVVNVLALNLDLDELH
jgi:potassium-transporting ATPase KdpC subunit